MPMKQILVVPDIHGRVFWKEPIKKYLDVVDRIVFLGDYLDPYEDEDGLAEILNHLKSIGINTHNRAEMVEYLDKHGYNSIQEAV